MFVTRPQILKRNTNAYQSTMRTIQPMSFRRPVIQRRYCKEENWNLMLRIQKAAQVNVYNLWMNEETEVVYGENDTCYFNGTIKKHWSNVRQVE